MAVVEEAVWWLVGVIGAGITFVVIGFSLALGWYRGKRSRWAKP